jgi:hypothetical protein
MVDVGDDHTDGVAADLGLLRDLLGSPGQGIAVQHPGKGVDQRFPAVLNV